MVRTRLNIGCRYSTPVRERPLHPTRGHFTPEPSQTQAPVTSRDRAGATRRWKLNNMLATEGARELGQGHHLRTDESLVIQVSTAPAFTSRARR